VIFRLPERVTYSQALRRSKKTLHVVMRSQLGFAKVAAGNEKRNGKLGGIHFHLSKLLAVSEESSKHPSDMLWRRYEALARQFADNLASQFREMSNL
jgi:hypothetical protein